jgi:hypothetical protein
MQIGRKIGVQMQDGRRHVQEGAEQEQDEVDQEEDDDRRARDAAERVAGQLRHAVEADQIAEGVGDADQQQHHAGGLHRLGRRLHEVLGTSACDRGTSSQHGIDHRDRRRFRGGEERRQDARR